MKRMMAVCLLGLAASGAWGMDLLEVYREALANDAGFAAARAQAEAGRERQVQGRAGLLPSIGASANTTWKLPVATTALPPPPAYASPPV